MRALILSLAILSLAAPAFAGEDGTLGATSTGVYSTTVTLIMAVE